VEAHAQHRLDRPGGPPGDGQIPSAAAEFVGNEVIRLGFDSDKRWTQVARMKAEQQIFAISRKPPSMGASTSTAEIRHQHLQRDEAGSRSATSVCGHSRVNFYDLRRDHRDWQRQCLIIVPDARDGKENSIVLNIRQESWPQPPPAAGLRFKL